MRVSQLTAHSSQLTAHSSQLTRSARLTRLFAGAVALTAAMPALAQQLLPQLRYSTHDWTVPTATEGQNFAEFWADTKSPGDGRIYSVGTIDVADTRPGALFSNAGAQFATGLQGFSLTSGAQQVAMLQVVNADQSIRWQRYFYGLQFGGAEASDASTNARGIAVWAEPNDTDTRIVICGETFAPVLPLSQAPAGNPLTSAATTSGFIAVFRGDGNLLWTHHVFGAVPGESCAITDVSIRIVKDEQGNPIEDLVTFCGITSHGNPIGGNASLTPVNAFTNVVGSGLPCSNAAIGTTDNGSGQWDGLVGRLRHVHTNPPVGGQTVEFLSLVGGRDQDGLFGIGELYGERLAVVGSTARGDGATSGLGTATFPLTTATCLAPAEQFCLGVVLTFDAAAAPGGAIVLEQANEIGTPGTALEPRHTIARDVLAQLDPHFSPVIDGNLVVVGSTDDPGALAPWAASGPDLVLDGPSDGFLVTALSDTSLPGFTPMSGTFRGGLGVDGLTGVQGWSEFPDHCVVVGFTDQGVGALDVDVASYLFDIGQPLRLLTNGQLGGAGLDLPTAMGPINTTSTAAPAFATGALGDHAGGGVAVDQQARVNVVGTTASVPPLGYPLQNAGLVVSRPRQVTTPPSNDAIRSSLDLLPATVGRTDGTGQPAPGPAGPYPIAGTTGGTTPACGLAPFGVRLGEPTPGLLRMLIDFEGAASAGAASTFVVVDRPSTGANINLMAMQFGFPNQPGFPPAVFPDGLEVWTTNAPVSFFVGPSIPAPVRFALTSPLPPAPLTFSVQLVCLHPALTVPGGPAAPCTLTTDRSASPALWISY